MPFPEPAERLNVSMVKSQSRRLVFRHIFQHGPVTRAAIAQETGLSQGTVKTIVDELVSSDIVTETKDRTAQVGRKPLKLNLKRDARTFAVLNIQPERTELHLLDLSLQPVGRRQSITHRRANQYEERLLAFLTSALPSAIPTAGTAPPLAAIGVAVPGAYDGADDHVICRIMPELGGFPLRSRLRGTRPVPVAIGEDVRLAALAEVGAPQRAPQPLFYYYAESGVGGAYLQEGRVLEGASQMAGEIGQMWLEGRGRLEELVRWPGFLERAGITSATDVNESTQVVQRRLSRGDATTRRALDEVAAITAIALSHVICILNPRSIVVGGPYAELGESFLAPLRRRVLQTLIPEHREVLEIRASAVGDSGMIRGAATIALEQWLDTAFTNGENE